LLCSKKILLPNYTSHQAFDKLKELKKQFSQTNKLKDLPTNITLLQTYRELINQNKILANKTVEQLLKKDQLDPNRE
jgi:capsular polysaccharide biosynthesis protein